MIRFLRGLLKKRPSGPKRLVFILPNEPGPKQMLEESKKLVVPFSKTIPGITVRNKYNLRASSCLPGDHFKVTVDDRKLGKQCFVEKITRHRTINTVITFDIEPGVLGLKDGLGAIFGEE